ncbi:MAG: gamma-glutamyltransferase, partial [Chloroflexi bacterium]|nr:gamma-glutamyltransferase [Chloroflexota bacterium]
EGGVEEFYTGGLARDIAAAFAAAGGLIDEADLAAQATHVTDDPPSVEYHGHRVYATPLPSHGVLTLEILSLLDGFDLAAMGHNTAESIHVMAEAKRLAYADRLAYVADPAFVEVPIDELLSKEHAARRRALIDASRAADVVGAGELAHAGAPSPHTSYFSVVDGAGNAVSYIHSNSAVFGSGFVAEGTGILFNNRVGRGFSLDAGHVNVIEPGKRSVNTIHSYMVTKDGALRFVGGTPGGDSQPQWNAQVLSRVIDHGMNVQEAADAPRWVHFPGTDPASIDRGMELRMEDGFDDDVRSGLGARGHNVTPYTEEMMVGAVQLIAIDPETGVRAGGTDRRCDGYPIPE